MDLANWQKRKIDPVRARRLASGYVLGALLLAGVLGTVAATAAKAYGLQEDAVVEAALVTTPKEEPVVEVKQPEPERAAPKPKALAAIVAPTKVDTKLVEKDPAPKSDNPFAAEDPYALLAAAGEAPKQEEPARVQEAPKVVAKIQPVAKKASSEPMRVTEEVEPPRALTMTAPSYPAEAKAAGIEGTVVVQYVVRESGEVSDVVAAQGPAELREVCVAAVRTWRFSPAMKDGHPVAVHRVARFPFRIKT